MNEQKMRMQRAMRRLRAQDQMGTGLAAGGMGAEATDRLADLDACTIGYRSWSPALIPGLLQTEGYAAEAIRLRTPSLPAEEVADRVRSRVRRSNAFAERRDAGVAHAWFVIGESAIVRSIGSDRTHFEQLKHLLSLSMEHPNMIIQVLRDMPPQPGVVEPFSIFALDQGPVLGHLEAVIGGYYTIVSEHVARLHSTFSDLNNWSMSSTESRTFIMEAASSCWDLIAEHRSSSPLTATPTTASTSPALPPAPSA